jgi:hypothetical protein
MFGGDFSRANFPYLYQYSISNLAREIRHLAEKNLIAPYGATGNTIVHKKTTQADDWGILSACNTYLNVSPYIANVGVNPDFQDLNKILDDLNIAGYETGIPTSMTTNPHASDEYFGLRYTINTNTNGEAVMIVSNPNPHSIHGVNFNFNKDFSTATYNYNTAFNNIINNTKAIDVLFEDGLVADVNDIGYKVNVYGTPSVGDVTSGFQLKKKYSIPFCTKNFTCDFGPFDTKVFYFNTQYSGNDNFNVSGWQKKWSNNGDGTIGGWGGPGYLSATDKFIPVSIDNDDAEELLCVQAIDATGTNVVQAGVKKYDPVSGSWSGVWDNNGSGAFASTFSGWTIHMDDKYLPGDFDGDGKTQEILCIHQNLATILKSSGTAPYTWNVYWTNNNNGNLRAGGGLWTISTIDKFQVGDFNGDGKNNDLLCVRAANNGSWSVITFSTTASPKNFAGIWNGTTRLFNNLDWTIHANDEFMVGDFDGTGNYPTNGSGKNEVLCMERTASPPRYAILKKTVGANSSSTEWHNSTFPGWTPVSGDNVIVADIDQAEGASPPLNKDEIMFIQSTTNAGGFATTEDLNSSNQPQWNWSNHNSGYPSGTQKYIGDWLVNDNCPTDVKYLFIKPVVADKKYLLAFKNYQNNTYLISMYATNANGAYNYRSAETEETISKPSISGFDFKLYPNPNNGSFEISSGNDKEKSIVVTDVVGRTIAEVKSNETDITIKLPDGVKGIYFVRMDDGARVGIKKIIVE